MDLLLVWRYIRANLKVVPCYGIDVGGRCRCGKLDCKSAGKHPTISDWPRKASNDVSTIAAWFGDTGEFRGQNLGIATGATSGIFVLDVDKKDGGLATLKQLEAGFGEIEAPCVQTGGGGLHFYFAYPREMKITGTTRVFPGIDLRGDGNFVVAPPSHHVSGQEYRWIEGEAPDSFPPAPPWLLEKLAQAQKDRKTLSMGSLMPDGIRNDALTSCAGSLRRRGFDENEIFECLQVLNRRCEPPLATDELRVIAKSVGKYASGDPTAGPTKAIAPGIVDGEALKGMEIAPPTWLVSGFALSKGLHVLAGASNTYKSWLGLGSLLAFSGGKHLSTHHLLQNGQGRTLYVAAEGSMQFLRRAKLLAQGMGATLTKDFLVYPGNPFLGSGDRRLEFETLLETQKPQIVILDPLRPIFGLREDTQEGWGVIVAWLLSLAQDRCIIVIHHLRKTPAGEAESFDMSSLSGPGILASSADYILLNRRREANEFEVVNVKSRDTALVDKSIFRLEAFPDRFNLVCADDSPMAITNPRESILTALRQRGAMPRSELKAVTGLPMDTILRTLSDLRLERKIESGDGPITLTQGEIDDLVQKDPAAGT